ncbi:hypothetical protein [Corynebacterium kroppenstedtii]|uniref:hypothetical protein n=1 Tax=Corynebacterium kroppenstedtii TaxID=161879 RepID=UPI00268AF163|nr:hypothetical protein [Corynebacterium kroppenstedtii]MDU7287719.1 hypothetical protein [Corynebacterium kroppenstedtii]
MSTLTVRTSKSAYITTRYTELGHDGSSPRYARLSIVGADDRLEFSRLASEMRNSNAKRRCEAYSIVQSWHPDELSIDSDDDIQCAHWAGLQLAERLAPTHRFTWPRTPTVRASVCTTTSPS